MEKNFSGKLNLHCREVHSERWQWDEGPCTRHPGRMEGLWVMSEQLCAHLREPKESQTDVTQNNSAAGRGSPGSLLDLAVDILSLDFCTAEQNLMSYQQILISTLLANSAV